ncbi:XK-related protein 8-like [Thalassophryne amazonica]|uniref:XK-related protein 8-like n=1 Tax=Thalassophryne amazonica TaxID=390379 RepID=UPI0014713C23|nr:XK-related protein 8-like [Thalassophryne amazonica]
MEEPRLFTFSKWDFLFTCLGLVFLLCDIVLDMWAVVTFYQEKAYVYMGILICFLLVSSVIVQIYSFLWYRLDNYERRTKVEKCPNLLALMLLHVGQLGIYLRHAGYLEVSVGSFIKKGYDRDTVAYLGHDLSMLRLMETFSESAPQLGLMLTVMLQRCSVEPITVAKAFGSAAAIACSVTMYHRSLRSFLPDKKQQLICSSVIYFLWNMLLIVSRLTALALFASVQPCFIFTHFICSWLVLFFVAWRAQTNFMEGHGEWLYRATVGLIWYFSWFNVVEGRTRRRTTIYHGYILVDICLLCIFWLYSHWKHNTVPPHIKISLLDTAISTLAVIATYVLGLLLKLIYYKFLHPQLNRPELRGSSSNGALTGARVINSGSDVTDSFHSADVPLPVPPLLNKRMRKLAENFYY